MPATALATITSEVAPEVNASTGTPAMVYTVLAPSPGEMAEAVGGAGLTVTASEMAAVELELVTTSKVNRLGEAATEAVKSTSAMSPVPMLHEPPRVTSRPAPLCAV